MWGISLTKLSHVSASVYLTTPYTLYWLYIKVRVFHQNESCLSCPHPPLSYEGRREQKGSSHFWWKTLILIGHYGQSFLKAILLGRPKPLILGKEKRVFSLMYISVANRQNPFPFLLVKLRNGALKFLVYFSLVCLGKYPKVHEKWSQMGKPIWGSIFHP